MSDGWSNIYIPGRRALFSVILLEPAKLCRKFNSPNLYTMRIIHQTLSLFNKHTHRAYHNIYSIGTLHTGKMQPILTNHHIHSKLLRVVEHNNGNFALVERKRCRVNVHEISAMYASALEHKWHETHGYIYVHIRGETVTKGWERIVSCMLRNTWIHVNDAS